MQQYGHPYNESYGRTFIKRAICRQFVNGSCRFGSSCHYLHPRLPVAPPTFQKCRYFEKGGCWFGERCKYLHVTDAESASTELRRGSAPSLYSYRVGHVQYYRRGSEPSLPQAQGLPSCGQSGHGLSQTPVAHPQYSSGYQTTNIREEHAAGSSSPNLPETPGDSYSNLTNPQGLGQVCPETSAPSTAPSGKVSARASEWRTAVGQQLESFPQAAAESGASARPVVKTGGDLTDAFNRSKDVTCGICMETVYEKPNVEERRFGILPNCCHSFCLSCIVTWRKTKNFREEVVKACPQCRVKSVFYIPYKYWVEGQSKETLTRDFKEKCSKRRCNFFMEHGCCPFKTECLYWHDLPHGYRPPRRRLPGRSGHAVSLDDLDSLQLLDYIIAMTLLDVTLDEESDSEFPLDFSDSYE
ncbi:hypothetical protein UPYG_G00004090 [Umbra pygmaea]|uniref:RING-type E3 ubiquitin transferase n=1 Tax=Umbra pygmaea TaxID=75934 RepID=A0ABD0XH11_UMBPY